MTTKAPTAIIGTIGCNPPTMDMIKAFICSEWWLESVTVDKMLAVVNVKKLKTPMLWTTIMTPIKPQISKLINFF
jgi:hypothetical protein